MTKKAKLCFEHGVYFKNSELVDSDDCILCNTGKETLDKVLEGMFLIRRLEYKGLEVSE